MMISVFLLCACSDDDDSTANEVILQNSCEMHKENQKYTECCIAGPLTVKSGGIFTARYTTNLSNPSHQWEVRGGSIEILGNPNSATVTFRAKGNFVSDTIVGLGQINSMNGIIKCSDYIIINSK